MDVYDPDSRPTIPFPNLTLVSLLHPLNVEALTDKPLPSTSADTMFTQASKELPPSMRSGVSVSSDEIPTQP